MSISFRYKKNIESKILLGLHDLSKAEILISILLNIYELTLMFDDRDASDAHRKDLTYKTCTVSSTN
jgi:hypothetical protein